MVMPDGEGWLLDMFSPPEPFRSGDLTPEQADDWKTITGWDSQRPYYSRDGVDRGDAERLLRETPESVLAQRWNYSPTLGTILRSIVAHPQVRGNAPAPEGIPDRPATGVLIDDPELLAFTPDIAPGPLPAGVAHLEPELRREYYHHRAGCIRDSVYRQRWWAARHRYDLHDARLGPDEIDVVTGPDGTQVLHLWWD